MAAAYVDDHDTWYEEREIMYSTAQRVHRPSGAAFTVVCILPLDDAAAIRIKNAFKM
jgi:hypothetical protein